MPPRTPIDKIPVAELHQVYGKPVETMRVWLSRGTFPAEYVHGADRTLKYGIYRDAYVTRRDALHWGRSTGRLLRDGTPNPAYSDKRTRPAA